MNFWKRLPLAQKISWTVVSVCTAAMTAFVSLFMLTQYDLLKMQAKQSMTALAESVAYNTASALTFGDRDAAHNTIRSLSAAPEVFMARVLDHEGQTFARYVRSNAEPGSDLSGEYVRTAIKLDMEQLGELELKYELTNVHQALRKTLWMACVLGFLSLLAVAGLSRWLARLLISPLLHLAHVADQVALSNDYRLRAPVDKSRDEANHLARRFNDMLAQIEQRNLDLRLHRDSLELEVKMRTDELMHSRDAAEAANRAKSVFLANMSHELRTPLNAVLGFSQLLQRDAIMSDDSRKKLATINRSGQHLLALINDVLEISRIEAGRSIIRSEPFDLSDLLTSVQEMMQLRADAKGLKFSVLLGADLPLAVQGDGPHLKQVLINLVGNAIKYTDQGQVRLNIQWRERYIEFQIVDTGPGISEKDQERIFQPFFQTEGGIAKGDGTGLGLAISQEYTRLMGGQLSIQSQLGQGSLFTLSVPLVPCDAPVVHNPAPGRVIGLEPGQTPVRVLVVDDKEDNRELVSQFLGIAGFEIATAANGLLAIEAFQSGRPHFIWMDMRMPVMDGYQATRKIRALPGGGAVKIVALTASAFEEDRKKILEAGCDDLVRKPLEEEQLFEVMRALLGLRYRYEEGSAPLSSVKAALDLSVLPVDLRQNLKAAADGLDVETTLKLLEQVALTHGNIFLNLQELVQGFRFDRISELCNAAEDAKNCPHQDTGLGVS